MRVLESPTLTAFTVPNSESLKGDNASTSNVEIPSTCGRLMGYMMGKAEGRGTDWHGHVTALSVAPEYRRLGLATQLMLELEETSER